MRSFVFLLALLLTPALATAVPPPKAPGPDGRYRIVFGPKHRADIFLLDSVSGQTWMICVDSTGSNRWCPVTRTQTPPMDPSRRDAEGSLTIEPPASTGPQAPVKAGRKKGK